MKVKNSSYLRSLTALLRSNIKNSSDPNEQCDPWYVNAPSITHLWTHRPQWRRRHKNRKKSNTRRFPTSTNSRINEIDLFDTLRLIERPISRSSTSPYETCSSRQIVTESELLRNYNGQMNHEVHNYSSIRRNQEFNRSVSMSESRSDTGLRKSHETQLVRPIRSQKRVGSRNSANSQATVGTFSSLEVNRSVQLSVERELQSDCNIPKRRVTFSNYVSENSMTNTKSHTSMTMNDNEADCLQESYEWFSDDNDDNAREEEDSSLQTNLSRLFSSMIFDLSRSSLSITSSRNSEKRKKSEKTLKNDKSESIFYINSSYSKESSCDLLSVKKICSMENYIDHDKSSFNRDEKDVDITRLVTKKSCTNNEIVNDVKKSEDINVNPYHRTIEYITVELKDISSTDKEITFESQKNLNNESTVVSSFYKNHIATDTSDLVELNHISSLPPVTELSKNPLDNVGYTLSEIIDFFQQPKQPQVDGILLKKLSEVDGKTCVNYATKKRVENIEKIGPKKFNENFNRSAEKIDLLRIDTETYGEYESVFVEMQDLDENFRESEIFDNSVPLEIEQLSVKPCKSIVMNLPIINKKSRFITSSKFQNAHSACSAVDKCCLICGRTKIDNPRYLRPVCQVKGVTPTPRLENDPWINVMKKVMKHDSRKEFIPRERANLKNKNADSHEESLMKTKDANLSGGKNSLNAMVSVAEKKRENVEKNEEECFSVIITETENTLPSISTPDSNFLSSRDRSTSCPLSESGFASSGSYDFATSSRTQSARTYYMRESVRTVNVTANRLLCVISESDTLMGLPQFLPKKPPDWFGRQVPRRKWPRR